MFALSSRDVTKLSGLKMSIRKDVLRCFLDGEPHEVNEIAERTGVSRQTVMKSLDFFINDGRIIPAGKGNSGASGGKRPLRYSMNPNLYLVCVTLWDRAFIVNLFNIKGELVDRISLDIPLPDTLQTAADNIGQLTSMLLRKNNAEPESVRAVSVSLAGNVDRKTNTLIFSSATPGWGTNVPLADYLKPFFPEKTMIFLQSSTKMVSAHYLQDREMMKKRLLVIAISRGGVAGSLIENGHILNGTNSLIGEIGHMIINPDDEDVCACGSRGCLNVRLAPERIRKMIRNESGRNPASALLSDKEELPYNGIFRAAEEGDPLALYCCDRITADLAVALHNASVMYDPDYVIFTGRDFIGNDVVDRMLREHLKLFLYYPNTRNPFSVVYDDCDLAEQDANGAMLSLRWTMLNDDERFADPDRQVPEAEDADEED